MAKTKDIANDPQKKKKVKSFEAINLPEVASEESKSMSELDNDISKEISSNEEDKKNNEHQEFNDLISDWTKVSQKILLVLNKKDTPFSKNKNPKSIMAFGAMGAHINMALQALKATESDQ